MQYDVHTPSSEGQASQRQSRVPVRKKITGLEAAWTPGGGVCLAVLSFLHVQSTPGALGAQGSPCSAFDNFLPLLTFSAYKKPERSLEREVFVSLVPGQHTWQ